MSVMIRLSGTHHYRGKACSFRNDKTVETLDHARAYVRKVIQSAREDRKRYRGRNAGRMVTYISVWPEGTAEGSVVDVWNAARGWHKGEVYLLNRYLGVPTLRTRSLPEEN